MFRNESDWKGGAIIMSPVSHLPGACITIAEKIHVDDHGKRIIVGNRLFQLGDILLDVCNITVRVEGLREFEREIFIVVHNQDTDVTVVAPI